MSCTSYRLLGAEWPPIVYCAFVEAVVTVVSGPLTSVPLGRGDSGSLLYPSAQDTSCGTRSGTLSTRSSATVLPPGTGIALL